MCDMAPTKDRILAIRLTEDELAHIELAAERAQRTRSDYARRLLLTAAGLLDVDALAVTT